MWPSPEAASRLYNYANYGLIFALILGVIATGLIVWMGKVKEEYLQRDFAGANERAESAKAIAATANERAAESQLKLEELREQVVKQGSRSSLLYGKRRDVLVEHLKPFVGQKAEVRFCDVSFSPQFIDNEVMSLTMLLQDILSIDSKWSVNPLARVHCSGTGLTVEINSKAPGTTAKAADVLLKALKEVPLAIVGNAVLISDMPRPPQLPMFNASGKELLFAPLGVDTIVITVLAHPL
jgi:hypothetical protein